MNKNIGDIKGFYYKMIEKPRAKKALKKWLIRRRAKRIFLENNKPRLADPGK